MVNTKIENLLSTINYPEDLRKLPLEKLPQVCEELRAFLIDELSRNPGHFASSLGVVELTVALHYVFNTPEDRIVWDVGHQAYGHKILTGRRENFHTNRHLGGIKPFPSPQESDYDTTTCGHASVSISAALGMAVAAKKQGIDRHVVAVIGDGAMSGGLAFEGLNNASSTPNDMLIILNDNNMSIDRAVGGMKEYLHQLHTSNRYNRLRNKVAQRLTSWGWLTDSGKKRIIRLNNSLKSFIHNQQNVFEGMDIRYFGPLEGNDVISLVYTLQSIKDMNGPKLLHLHTKKGHGYQPAENNPTAFHAPGKFDPETGEQLTKNADGEPPRYQDVFGETLLEMAKKNPRIVGVTPAMPSGCSMNIMMKEMPDRCFDVGIAEGHAVTFSAGMAKDGLIPVCNIYSSFAQRSYDNVIHDVAINKLHVVMCLDRAGIVGEDGPTHHGVFDMPSLRTIPNLTIASPMNEAELRRLMYTAIECQNGPFVIRYPRGNGVMVDWQCPLEALPIGKGRLVSEEKNNTPTNKHMVILSMGPLGNTVQNAINAIAQEQDNAYLPAHYDMRFLKPLDEEIMKMVAEKYDHIITIEDGSLNGGFGSAILEWLADNGFSKKVTRLGIPDKFIEHGAPAQLYKLVGLDVESIIKIIRQD
ncbi:MAG: 1-deoxy-D-xylulose-5-phosphate synthase [Bacteroidaceae bacterium]|nr:1-deoxy-D-xylulose-5-phosphate synthase [Bacteroidaceae bacterium]MBQ5913344.1 1-deoxy-D-xylulose-5-phosphate synthase [Bacteroidaceae bacterium]